MTDFGHRCIGGIWSHMDMDVIIEKFVKCRNFSDFLEVARVNSDSIYDWNKLRKICPLGLSGREQGSVLWYGCFGRKSGHINL